MYFGLRTSEVTLPEEPLSIKTDSPSLDSLLKREGTPSIILLVETSIDHAATLRASDIHFEPTEHSVRVRFRIDGVLIDICTLPTSLHQEVITRIRVLAHLRTDEHNAAQDGRFKIKLLKNQSVDIRVSIMPTYYGENAILRLLTNYDSVLTLEDLGLSNIHQNILTKATTQPNGMILVTGPTGSGKTSTLYTLIQLLNTKDIKIITVEDPIEYAIAGITQIQINERSDLTFATGLRSMLRQDPDVIMVGEIRDRDTASLAVNTALTGHLMLSTLHTNNAASTLPRLLDMGIDAYLVASTVRVTIAQRLVRTLCNECKQPHNLNAAESNNLNLLVQSHSASKSIEKSNTFYQGKGCSSCQNTGYKGRTGIYKILLTSPRVKEAIIERASATTINTIAFEEGMTTMFDDGLNKARLGTTSLSEIIRAAAVEC